MSESFHSQVNKNNKAMDPNLEGDYRDQGNQSILKTIYLKALCLMTIISFLWSGLTLNALQLVNYLLLRRLNFELFVKVNYYLLYSAWSQVVALFDWFYRANVTVYHGSKDQEKEIFKDHSIFLANHGYELDWLGAWLIMDKFERLATCKAMLKSDLKYIPIVGWSWALSDQLFLERDWEKDKHKINGSIDILLKYKPMIATFFCEGARFTKKNYEACQKFANERGIEAPKYHLIPRTKGFVAVMKHLKQKQREDPSVKFRVYNAQIAYDDRGALSLSDIVNRGFRPKCHVYFKEIPVDEIPNDDEGCAQWLHNLFLIKDKLHEHFTKEYSFEGYEDSKFVNYKTRPASVANWLFWNLYTFLPLAYLVLRLYYRYGTFLVSLVVSIFCALSYSYLSYVMYQTDVSEERRQDKKAK